MYCEHKYFSLCWVCQVLWLVFLLSVCKSNFKVLFSYLYNFILMSVWISKIKNFYDLHYLIILDNFLHVGEGNPYGMVSHMRNSNIAISEFKLQSHYYIHFQANPILFTNPSARAGYDTRSIFKRSLTGLN